MGNCNCNCIEFSRGVSWVDNGEYSTDPEEEETKDKKIIKQEEESKPISETKTETMAPTEVKIKISKKQLEKLIQQVDSNNLQMQDLLAGLVKIGQSCQNVPEKDHRYWRPALKSIPELVEQ